MSQINSHIGQQLKKRRKTLKLSQTQLGEILGITYQQVQKYESGVNKVSPERLLDLSHALDTPLEYFFEGVRNAEGFIKAKPHESTTHVLVSPEKAELLEMYDELPTNVKRHLREFVKEMASSQKTA